MQELNVTALRGKQLYFWRAPTIYKGCFSRLEMKQINRRRKATLKKYRSLLNQANQKEPDKSKHKEVVRLIQLRNGKRVCLNKRRLLPPGP